MQHYAKIPFNIKLIQLILFEFKLQNRKQMASFMPRLTFELKYLVPKAIAIFRIYWLWHIATIHWDRLQ